MATKIILGLLSHCIQLTVGIKADLDCGLVLSDIVASRLA